MKLSFKTNTLIAAIGMVVYTIYVVMRYAIREFYPVPYHYDLLDDICVRLIFDILPLSMIVACCGLWKYRPAMETSKSFHIFTVCLFVALVGTLLFSPLNSHQIAGVPYLFPSIYWRAIMLISGIVWLLMLRKQPLEDATPHSYQATLIIAMILLALPVVLEAISGIALLCGNEYVLGLRSSTILTWVKYIAPILPLIHFVFPSIKKINYTLNTHCSPGSYDKRTFKRNRIITLTLVGIAIVAMFVACYILPILDDIYVRRHGIERELAYNTYLPYYTNISTICLWGLIVSLPFSWIMLSVMAFRQLPNPTGYKIYNVICQCITWGSLFLAVIFSLADQPIADIFVVLFFIAGCAFYITTTIRVISYSIPIGADKLKGIELKEGAIIPD